MSIETVKNKISTVRQQIIDINNERINVKPQMLKEYETKFVLLQAAVAKSQEALNQVFSEKDVAGAKATHNQALEDLEACKVVMTNLTTYINQTSIDLIRELEEQSRNLTEKMLVIIHDDLIVKIKDIPQDTIELLKDYVVISQSGTGSPKGRYGLGSGISKVFGELRGDDFRAHKEQLESKLNLSL